MQNLRKDSSHPYTETGHEKAKLHHVHAEWPPHQSPRRGELSHFGHHRVLHYPDLRRLRLSLTLTNRGRSSFCCKTIYEHSRIPALTSRSEARAAIRQCRSGARSPDPPGLLDLSSLRPSPVTGPAALLAPPARSFEASGANSQTAIRPLYHRTMAGGEACQLRSLTPRKRSWAGLIKHRHARGVFRIIQAFAPSAFRRIPCRTIALAISFA